jgi:hypothetical protein
LRKVSAFRDLQRLKHGTAGVSRAIFAETRLRRRHQSFKQSDRNTFEFRSAADRIGQQLAA